MSIDAQRSDNRTLLQKAGKVPWLLVAILALAGFLRVFGLGSESVWADEAFSLNVCDGSIPSIVLFCVRFDTHPPLYYLILDFWMLLFGHSEAAIRFLSACFGIISVLLIYKVGHELFERRVGLIAAFILAISAFAIDHSQEARHYSLLLLLTLLSFLFFVRVLKAGKQRKMNLICYSLANILLSYTHVYGLFIIVSQVLYFLLFRYRYTKAERIFWAAQAITLVAFSPWLLILVTRTLTGAIYGIDWLPQPSLMFMIDTLVAFTGDGVSGAFYGLPTASLILGFLVFCLAGVFYFPKPGLSQKTKRIGMRILLMKPKTALLLIWFFFPFVMSLAISFAITPIFWPKYLIGVTPALYLLVARGIGTIHSFVNTYVPRVNVTCILVALVALLSLPGLYDLYAHHQEEEWREVTDLIEKESQPDDIVVICHAAYILPFDYYYQGDLERWGIDYRVTDNEELANFIDDAASGKERLWLILMTYPLTRDAPIKTYLFMRYGGDSLVMQKDFVAITAYLFDIKPGVSS